MSHTSEILALKAPLATLRKHLDLEVAEFDEHGRYVLDFEAMAAVVDAVDEMEELLDDDEKGDVQ